LDYKQARQRRVQQLERQRHSFLHQDNIVPFLGCLPQDLTPFGAQRYASEVAWAATPAPDLFPPPLPLECLDLEQAQALRTWFVAHVDIPPRQTSRRRSSAHPKDIQLSLL
jgi:deoxyribodipyrimidine photo-lyase